MQGQVISFKCLIRNKAGHLISTTYNREVLTLNEMPPTGILWGLNKNLQNLKKGEKRSILVLAEEAYGLYDPTKVILYPRKKLPKNIIKGELVQIISKNKIKNSYCVVETYSDHVRLDGNHPLAGQDLIFDVETLDAREATEKEIVDALNPVNIQLLH
jgi:FKBP-type peptidyl-prolyl cis-trans isomerase SlyD